MEQTGGRHSLTSLLTGLPVVMMTTRGARSGQLRRVPLVPLVDGEAVILIASAFGSPHNPAWYHNLQAFPQATLSTNGESGIYRARPASAAEWSRYWQMAVETYPGYAAYRARCPEREIPILVLTPELRPKDEV
jgi:deazaflavin-dependent oxidoreductase (nitroreductase family)